MLNLDRDQLLMLEDAMETLRRHYITNAQDIAASALTKERAINDSIRCDRILDAIGEDLNGKY